MTDVVSILRLAEDQHALVTRLQLRHLHVSAKVTRRLLFSGWLEELTMRVLRVGGSPDTADQRVLAAVLDVHPAARLSHLSALRRWGVPGLGPEPVDVSVLRSAPPAPGRTARVHRLRALPLELCTLLGNIPIVRPELALYQACGLLHPDRAERVIDAAWRLRLVSGRSMRRALEMLQKQGRNGTTVYRALLDPRGDDYVPPDSGLEGRFAQILRQAGEPPMRRQVQSGGDVWVGRVDYRDDNLPLIVEIQSERYHTALSDRVADAARHKALEATGFRVLEIWDSEVWTQPGQVVAKIRTERRLLRERLQASGRENVPVPGANPRPERGVA